MVMEFFSFCNKVVYFPLVYHLVFISISKVDPRLAPLVLFVKHWAKVQDINDASRGTISSYSLVLMVIHYLQCKSVVIIHLSRLLYTIV